MNASSHKAPAGKASGPGVDFIPVRGRWLARARIDGRRVCLGYFKSPEEASAAYRTARKLHPVRKAGRKAGMASSLPRHQLPLPFDVLP